MILRSALKVAAFLGEALLESVYPESCVLCGEQPHRVSWTDRGEGGLGLRSCDKPHLCRGCLLGLTAEAPLFQEREIDAGIGLLHVAGAPTTADLTAVVGAWKYHGLRGLAWPLAEIMNTALDEAIAGGMNPGTLVPVPLHGRRRRTRGFNQAAQLAFLASRRHNLQFGEDLAKRAVNTGQQARLTTLESRRANLEGSFRVVTPDPRRDRRLTLVDDLVTSGATTGELARTLRRAGWEVELVLAVGMSRQPSGGADPEPAGVQVDTARPPS